MRKILLRGKYGQGKHTIVDDEDYEELSKYNWFMSINGYVIRNRITADIKNGWKSKGLRMHRIILDIKEPTLFADHINGDRLDNRRSNLRIVSRRQNNFNLTPRKNTSSGYRGVFDSTRKKVNKWNVQICADGKSHHIGYYADVKEAARAYNEAALKYHGKYARLNIID